ncbi:UNVERIFIED_ORG: hypothetical protein QE446_005091 [Rhizobium sp. SORGH_AS260]|nr:hypothetical protein [Rhizobium sp. SORGH_AS_0260]MDR6084094.1 hypothetical protein [Agrobacterium sp. SORGH_AS_0440]
MSASSFCGWGIRIIPSTETRYNPMSYHNGSIWPHDNALIASGLARYGYRAEAARIFEGLFAASTYIDLRRLPELFCGLPRQRAQGPTFYPVACSPQAWSAAAPLFLLQSCLGLDFDPHGLRIKFEEPHLPAFLDEVTLKHLLAGTGSADVALRRSGRHVVVDVIDRRVMSGFSRRHDRFSDCASGSLADRANRPALPHRRSADQLARPPCLPADAALRRSTLHHC